MQNVYFVLRNAWEKSFTLVNMLRPRHVYLDKVFNLAITIMPKMKHLTVELVTRKEDFDYDYLADFKDSRTLERWVKHHIVTKPDIAKSLLDHHAKIVIEQLDHTVDTRCIMVSRSYNLRYDVCSPARSSGSTCHFCTGGRLELESFRPTVPCTCCPV